MPEDINVKIGLEIHVPLKTRQKLFCYCPTNYWEVEEPNINTCPVCTGMPGAKPYPLNREALDTAIMVAELLNCAVIKDNVFVKRKHYDYPDLPSGYQRTSEPVGRDGRLGDVGIWEVHLEEDPGRYDLESGRVDYNRSGVPLIEVVTAPDMHSPEEVRNFLRELVNLLKYTERILDVGGVMRADVNISIEGGAKVEIKNINSVKGAFKAIQFEIIRQKGLMRRGVAVRQETRGFNEKSLITVGMRVKETAADYRYIPDPDIPPLLLDNKMVEGIVLPETPQSRRKRFVENGIPPNYAGPLVGDKDISDLYEEVDNGLEVLISETSDLAVESPSNGGTPVTLSKTPGLAAKSSDRGGTPVKISDKSNLDVGSPDNGVTPVTIPETPDLTKPLASRGTPVTPSERSTLVAKWHTQYIPKQLNYRGIELSESKLNKDIMVELLQLLLNGEITEAVGKKLLEKMIDSGESPRKIVEKENLDKVSGVGELDKVVDKVIAENQQAVADFKTGKNETLNFLMGGVMKATKGTADPEVVRKILKKKLG